MSEKENPAVHEAGQGPTGATNERFAGGGLEPDNDRSTQNSGGGTDTGITGDDSAGGGLTGNGSGASDALVNPHVNPGAI